MNRNETKTWLHRYLHTGKEEENHVEHEKIAVRRTAKNDQQSSDIADDNRKREKKMCASKKEHPLSFAQWKG